MQILGIIVIVITVLGILAALAMFRRMRAQAGYRLFQLTEADKAQLKKMRDWLAIRRLLAGFIGCVGGYCLLVAIISPMYPDSNWRSALGFLAFGAFLIFCVLLLVGRSKR